MNIKQIMSWKLFWILLVGCLISTALVLPYLFSLQASQLETVSLGRATIVGVWLLQSAILYSIVIFLGLKAAQRIWLPLPLLTAWVEHSKVVSGIKNNIYIYCHCPMSSCCICYCGWRYYFPIGLSGNWAWRHCPSLAVIFGIFLWSHQWRNSDEVIFGFWSCLVVWKDTQLSWDYSNQYVSYATNHLHSCDSIWHWSSANSSMNGRTYFMSYLSYLAP